MPSTTISRPISTQLSSLEARKFSWAGTGSAAVNTAKNGTSAGVLASVRTRWFSKHLSTCIDDTGVLGSNPRLAGRVVRDMGREILLISSTPWVSAAMSTPI